MAAIVRRPGSKCTRTPVSTGRDSSRDAALDDALDGGEERIAVEVEDALRIDLGEPREVVDRMRVQLVLAGAGGDADAAVGAVGRERDPVGLAARARPPGRAAPG